jgi:tripartite-type tricarboxylate transporter receptor subunit TctC
MKSSVGCAAAALLCLALPVFAQSFPARPIRVISPLPPGSGVDTILRKSGEELQKRLGQPLIFENRPGGNMTIGTDLCVRSAPDGHTYCLLSGSSMSFMPHTFSKMPYDPDKDLRPVVLLFHLIEGMLTKADLQVRNAGELKALALANPGKLNFGTLGPDTTTDISRRYLNELWKADIAGIHYKGGPQIITALAGGEIDFSRIGVFNAISLLKGGRLKILAIGGTKRSPLLPEVPTMDEVGLSGIPPERPWWGLGTQAAAPDAIVRRMNGEFVRLFREPSFVEFLDTQYVESGVGTPEQFAAFLKKDREEAGQLVKHFNIPKQ